MSNLAIQDLYDRKVDEASEMSTRELISALKGSISSPKVLSRDSMIDIVAMKLANDELRDALWEMNFFGELYLLLCFLP
mgnify:CR=1 FL=1